MKQKVNILILLLVAIFFVSTTGVTIYKHHCSHGGEFYGVYMDVEHGCVPENTELIEEPHDCCVTTSENEFHVEDDCCESDVKVYQIDTDLNVQDVKIDFINNYTLSFTNFFTFKVPEYRKIPTSNKAPPALSTLKRLSLYQVYLI